MFNLNGPPAVHVECMLRVEFIVVSCSGGMWDGRCMNEPTPGLARWRRCIVLSERLRVGEDDVLRSTWLGVFFSMVEG